MHTCKVDILRCGPELCEDVLLHVVGDGQEAEDASTGVVDEHDRKRRPHLPCTSPAPNHCSDSFILLSCEFKW